MANGERQDGENEYTDDMNPATTRTRFIQLFRIARREGSDSILPIHVDTSFQPEELCVAPVRATVPQTIYVVPLQPYIISVPTYIPTVPPTFFQSQSVIQYYQCILPEHPGFQPCPLQCHSVIPNVSMTFQPIPLIQPTVMQYQNLNTAVILAPTVLAGQLNRMPPSLLPPGQLVVPEQLPRYVYPPLVGYSNPTFNTNTTPRFPNRFNSNIRQFNTRSRRFNRYNNNIQNSEPTYANSRNLAATNWHSHQRPPVFYPSQRRKRSNGLLEIFEGWIPPLHDNYFGGIYTYSVIPGQYFQNNAVILEQSELNILEQSDPILESSEIEDRQSASNDFSVDIENTLKGDSELTDSLDQPTFSNLQCQSDILESREESEVSPKMPITPDVQELSDSNAIIQMNVDMASLNQTTFSETASQDTAEGSVSRLTYRENEASQTPVCLDYSQSSSSVTEVSSEVSRPVVTEHEDQLKAYEDQFDVYETFLAYAKQRPKTPDSHEIEETLKEPSEIIADRVSPINVGAAAVSVGRSFESVEGTPSQSACSRIEAARYPLPEDSPVLSRIFETAEQHSFRDDELDAFHNRTAFHGSINPKRRPKKGSRKKKAGIPAVMEVSESIDSVSPTSVEAVASFRQLFESENAEGIASPSASSSGLETCQESVYLDYRQYSRSVSELSPAILRLVETAEQHSTHDDGLNAPQDRIGSHGSLHADLRPKASVSYEMEVDTTCEKEPSENLGDHVPSTNLGKAESEANLNLAIDFESEEPLKESIVDKSFHAVLIQPSQLHEMEVDLSNVQGPSEIVDRASSANSNELTAIFEQVVEIESPEAVVSPSACGRIGTSAYPAYLDHLNYSRYPIEDAPAVSRMFSSGERNSLNDEEPNCPFFNRIVEKESSPHSERQPEMVAGPSGIEGPSKNVQLQMLPANLENPDNALNPADAAAAAAEGRSQSSEERTPSGSDTTGTPQHSASYYCNMMSASSDESIALHRYFSASTSGSEEQLTYLERSYIAESLLYYDSTVFRPKPPEDVPSCSKESSDNTEEREYESTGVDETLRDVQENAQGYARVLRRRHSQYDDPESSVLKRWERRRCFSDSDTLPKRRKAPLLI